MLTDFHLFPKLPTEIRLKIWNSIAQHPRIVAVEFLVEEFIDDLDDEDLGSEEPATWMEWSPRVCPQSRQPPLLQINQEAREEGSRIYEYRRIFGSSENYYFNPDVDILYLCANDSSWSATCQIFCDYQVFPRVAIDLGTLQDPELDIIPGLFSRAGRIMADLHGADIVEVPIDSDESDEWQPSHPMGLQEVFFVNTARATHPEAMDIDHKFEFREADHWGTHTDEMSLTLDFLDQVDLVEKDKPVGENSKTVWIGEDKPTFRFVTFAPCLKSGFSGEIIQVSALAANKLKEGESGILTKLLNDTGCEMVIDDLDDVEYCLGEIVIKGPRAGVDRCKKAIEDVLVSYSYREVAQAKY